MSIFYVILIFFFSFSVVSKLKKCNIFIRKKLKELFAGFKIKTLEFDLYTLKSVLI